jgi:hypothetical protein
VRRLAACAAGAAALVTATVPGLAGPGDPLERAARAVDQVAFTGLVTLTWDDGREAHTYRLEVRGASGAVIVQGDKAVLASPTEGRLVQHGREWDRLWPAALGPSGRPDLGDKYRLELAPREQVGGRQADVVEVYEGPVLRERLHVDLDSGLVLRRAQFEDGGRAARTVGFERIEIGSSAPPPTLPLRIADRAPSPLASTALPSWAAAPPALAGGYQRVGVYRHGDLVQVLYSDGLYDLSVFEEPGRLGRDRPGEGGREVRVGGVEAWHAAWPGGHVMVWEAGRVVFTAVTDAPYDQVVRAVASLPEAGASPSFLQRLRRLCRSLLQPLAG